MSSKFSVFQNSAGLLAVAAWFEDDTVWLAQQNLADLYHTTKQHNGQHFGQNFGISRRSRVK